MNKSYNNIINIETKEHIENISIITKTLNKYKILNSENINNLLTLIEEQNIKKNPKIELENIYNNKSDNEAFEYKEETIKNDKNLLDKINNNYEIFILNLNKFNVNDIDKNIPNILKILFQFNKLDIYLFIPIYQSFINFYISNFINKKIFELRKESLIDNPLNKKFFDISLFQYEQELDFSLPDKFLSWIQMNLKNQETILPYYKEIFEKNLNNFISKLESHYNNFLIYSTDYLKSPFDKDKINYIYKKSLKHLRKEKNKNFLLLKNKKETEIMMKLIIQENMLDFIKENIYLESFLNNKDFYLNKEKMKKDFENKKISRKLYEKIGSYIFKNSNNELEYEIMLIEYDKYIRQAISDSVIEFYSELLIYNQLLYFNINNNMNDNKIIKDLMINYIKKYLNILKKEDKETFNIFNNKFKNTNDLKNISNIYKEIFNNIKSFDLIYNFNEEEYFLLKFSEYTNYIESSNKNNFFYKKNLITEINKEQNIENNNINIQYNQEFGLS